MNNTPILVLGAGELGMAVLRGLTPRAAELPGTSITVLLRPSTIDSQAPDEQRDLAELRALGVSILPGDLTEPPICPLSSRTSTP